MKPFSLYHLAAEDFSALQPALVEIVVKAASPDFIFLLGASRHSRRSESIFHPSAPSSHYLGDGTLLVLLGELEGKDTHEWQDKIEAHCASSLLPVTAIVVRTARFLEWLQEGDRFALTVLGTAPCIYQSGNFTLPEPEGPVPPFPGKELQKKHAGGLLRAGEFLAGAELFRLRKQYALAAFMLHQAAEQALRTLVMTGTGYAPNTHSLERLVRYAGLVSYKVADIFPQRTERDKRLFRLLQKAYIDTRYGDYSISEAELSFLTGKVKALHLVLSEQGRQLFASSSPAMAT